MSLFIVIFATYDNWYSSAYPSARVSLRVVRKQTDTVVSDVDDRVTPIRPDVDEMYNGNSFTHKQGSAVV